MTRKDYILIAAALLAERPAGTIKCEDDLAPVYLWEMLVRRLGRDLAVDNPKFDRTRFYQAAGMVEWPGGWVCGGVTYPALPVRHELAGDVSRWNTTPLGVKS
jgi:hypothetical protein